MVPAENRGPCLGAAGDVCSWLAPTGGPVLRSGARRQVQPAHCGPHAGIGDLAWSISLAFRNRTASLPHARAMFSRRTSQLLRGMFKAPDRLFRLRLGWLL